MFSLVVIAVAISVVTMYVRHDRFMRRKRLAARAGNTAPPKPDERDEPR